jgi:ApaG protein
MYEQETLGLVVRVAPEFVAEQSIPHEGRYVWAYTVEIENRTGVPVQLMSRYWRITDENGHTQEVRGQGVIGEQPVIAPGERYSYTSACPLAAPSGVMMGAYSMQSGDGDNFDIIVPTFSLDSPYNARRVN